MRGQAAPQLLRGCEGLVGLARLHREPWQVRQACAMRLADVGIGDQHIALGLSHGPDAPAKPHGVHRLPGPRKGESTARAGLKHPGDGELHEAAPALRQEHIGDRLVDRRALREEAREGRLIAREGPVAALYAPPCRRLIDLQPADGVIGQRGAHALAPKGAAAKVRRACRRPPAEHLKDRLLLDLAEARLALLAKSSAMVRPVCVSIAHRVSTSGRPSASAAARAAVICRLP